jgi:hypothetical protein
VEIFEQIESFFRRLEIYTEVPPTPLMKDTMVRIMVEVLDMLGIATKEIKQSRTSELNLLITLLLAHIGPERFLKKLAGWTDMKDVLKKLDKLTNEEARMANAQALKNTHVIDVLLRRVDENVQGVDAQVNNVTGELKRVRNIVDDVKRSSPVLSSLTVEYLNVRRKPTTGAVKKMAIPAGSIHKSLHPVQSSTRGNHGVVLPGRHLHRMEGHWLLVMDSW